MFPWLWRMVRHPPVWCGTLVFLATVSLYVQTRTFDFVEYDDQIYTYQNPHVQQGLCGSSIRWALGNTAATTANWQPLTFLSYLFDVSLFGMDPGAMHLHNALLHGVDSVLLFAFLLLFLKALARVRVMNATMSREPGQEGQRATSDAESRDPTWFLVSALLATLFWSLHPLRVDSVAWVASRKDVLCMFWFLLGHLLYLADLRRDCARRLAEDWKICVAGVCCILACMAKPTAMVFPCTAALLEYTMTLRISWRRNALFVYIAVIFMAITVCMQDAGGALDRGTLSFSLRLANAVAGVGQYVSSTIWPHNLCCFYPYEVPIPWRRFLPGSFFLLGVLMFILRYLCPILKINPPFSFLKARTAEKNGVQHPPFILAMTAGLLWFCISLVPVSGLLQVGLAACADRFSYLPGIGLSLALAALLWYASLHEHPLVRNMTIAVAILCLTGLYGVSYRQVGVWRNQFSLFWHAQHAVKGNHVAYTNVGTCYFNDGKYAEAMEQFLECAKVLNSASAAMNLASALSKLAGDDYIKDVFQHPVDDNDPLAAKKYHALGLLASFRRLDGLATEFLGKSLALNPAEYQAWEELGVICERQEKLHEAEVNFREASVRNPADRGLRAKLRQLEHANRRSGKQLPVQARKAN
jgi:hypothetical protein